MYVSETRTNQIRKNGIRLKSSILNSLNNSIEINTNNSECAVDYIWGLCYNKCGFELYDKAIFKK